MDETSSGAVILRALGYGICMGAVTGGPGIAAFFASSAVVAGPGVLGLSLIVTVIGGVLGGLVGLAAAVLPGIVVASASDCFRRHLLVARLCTALISGLEVDVVFVIGHRGFGAAASTGGGVAFLVGAFSLFAAVGAYGTKYVLDGRKCRAAVRALRYVRRMCPCRRFRVGGMSASAA